MRVYTDTDGSSLGLLRDNKLFAGLSSETIGECARRFVLTYARRRQDLYQQGDACDRLFCLLRGSVRVARLAEDGSELTTRIVGPCEIFGEESLFDDASFSATATPLCDGIVAVCSAAIFRSLIARYPALSINIAQYLREDRNRTLNRLELISHKPVRVRLLALLQDLAAQCPGDVQGGKHQINLTHAEMASLIGSTRETVSSELSKLARAGLIAKRGRKILIDLTTNEAA